VPLPKSSDPDRIASNIQVFDFKLDEDDMAKLNSLDRGDKGAVTWNPVNSP
jgi:diketogulonate reductase-like aldo/keto reductase